MNETPHATTRAPRQNSNAVPLLPEVTVESVGIPFVIEHPLAGAPLVVVQLNRELLRLRGAYRTGRGKTEGHRGLVSWIPLPPSIRTFEHKASRAWNPGRTFHPRCLPNQNYEHGNIRWTSRQKPTTVLKTEKQKTNSSGQYQLDL